MAQNWPKTGQKLVEFVFEELTIIDSNDQAASIAKFGIKMVETGHTKRPTLSHDVPLPSKRLGTFSTSKMSQMPVPALGLCTLVR